MHRQPEKPESKRNTKVVNQWSAQTMLGHFSPELTAKAYTDTTGLDLSREVAKLPLLGGG